MQMCNLGISENRKWRHWHVVYMSACYSFVSKKTVLLEWFHIINVSILVNVT